MEQNKTVIIDEQNMRGLASLYGSLDTNDLTRIVNKHIAVAIQEIMEDEGVLIL